MALIDSLVVEKHLRDNLLRNVAMDYLLKVHMTSEESDAFIANFEKLACNEKHINEIKNLSKGIKSLQPNQELPHLVLKDINENTTTLKEVARNKNVVFYFWIADQKRHFRNVCTHIEKLKVQHPDHYFIGINLKTPKEHWKSILNEKGLNPAYQYHGEDFETVQQTLIVDNLNKCLITEDTLIVNAFGNLYASFEPTKKP